MVVREYRSRKQNCWKRPKNSLLRVLQWKAHGISMIQEIKFLSTEWSSPTISRNRIGSFVLKSYVEASQKVTVRCFFRRNPIFLKKRMKTLLEKKWFSVSFLIRIHVHCYKIIFHSSMKFFSDKLKEKIFSLLQNFFLKIKPPK